MKDFVPFSLLTKDVLTKDSPFSLDSYSLISPGKLKKKNVTQNLRFNLNF